MDTLGFRIFSFVLLFFIAYGFGSLLMDIGSLFWK